MCLFQKSVLFLEKSPLNSTSMIYGDSSFKIELIALDVYMNNHFTHS